jgi:hypothetical protein
MSLKALGHWMGRSARWRVQETFETAPIAPRVCRIGITHKRDQLHRCRGTFISAPTAAFAHNVCGLRALNSRKTI